MATSSFLATVLLTIILFHGEMLKLALASGELKKPSTQGILTKAKQTTSLTPANMETTSTTSSTPANMETTSTTSSTPANMETTSTTLSTPANMETTSTTSSTPTNTSVTLDTLSAIMSNLSTELEVIKVNCSTNPLPPTTLNTLMEIMSNLSKALELIKCPTNTLPSTTPNMTIMSSPIPPSQILPQTKKPENGNDSKSLKPSKTLTQTTGTEGSGFSGSTKFLLIPLIVIATLVIGYLTWYNRQHLCGLYRRCKKYLLRKDQDVKGSYKRVPIVVDKQDMDLAQSYVY